MSPGNRKWLHHNTPSWISRSDAVYFITLNCHERQNTLANDQVADFLFESITHYYDQEYWYPHVVLIMPDHLHGLFSFPETGKPMSKLFSQWKSYTAKHLDFKWQPAFFDHRLRSNESFDEKLEYIRNNPVRAGLINNKNETWEIPKYFEIKQKHF